jgi:hypothetical protein
MKKNLLLLVTLVALAFTACQKEDSESGGDKLKGTWKNTAMYTNYYNEQGVKVFTEQDTSGFLDFEFDGKSIAKITAGDDSLNITIPVQYNLSTVGGTDYLTLVSGLGNEKYTISTLSGTKLKLEVDTDETEYTVNDEDITANRAVNVMEFTKK